MAEPAAPMPQATPPTQTSSWLARIRSIVRGLGPAGPWLLVASGGPLLGLMVLTATSARWLPWFGEGFDSALVFCALGAVMAGLCMVPTQVVSLLAGYLFGAWLGSVLSLLVVLVAAIIGFQLWSRVVGSRVLEAIGKEHKANRVHRALLGRSAGRTIWLIALLRLSPVMPFAATNLLMASFGVRGPVFLAATVIGVAPRLVAVSLIGAGLSELDWQATGSRWTTIVAIVATILCIAMISRIAKNALRRETEDVEVPASKPEESES
ncbi:MAG: putative membrane protein YdjX (TVP38/TMEM64 family) [Hyphomicrobiaceae bacterium]|jgi:uncharacterized membrane protein YdjX (TVP38/TMEM64 family)